MTFLTTEYEAGAATSGRAITAILYVSPDGAGSDGLTWAKAYTTIQAALDAASTDANDVTLIMVAPHATYYDIATDNDPTWTGNYEIRGSHRIWASIRNTNVSATSVMKFTGKVSLVDLAIFTDSTNNANGVIFTNNGWRVRKCGFNSSGTDGANTSVYIDGSAALTRGGIMEDVQFIGHVTHTKAVYINQSTVNEFHHVSMHTCLTAIHIDDTDSDNNEFHNIDIGDCATGIDLDAGNEQHFDNINLHNNTTNIDDASADHDHTWSSIHGQFDMDTEPQDLTGTTITASATALAWGADEQLRAAATATKPFRILGYYLEPAVTQKHKMRFKVNGDSTYFDEIYFDDTKNSVGSAPAGTEHIFNVGDRIDASCKAESNGSDTVKVWLKVQAI